MLKLVEVKDAEHVEWLRVKRNIPSLMKYFRQDKPITPVQQQVWWKRRDRSRIKIFIVAKDNKWIGYVGFNPLDRYARKAEFGMFIIPEEQDKGYGREALDLLLEYGFKTLCLSVIYSDLLDYPGENRFEFYRQMGFSKRENALPKTYMKQGIKIPSLPFYMSKETWQNRGIVDSNSKGELASIAAAATGEDAAKRGRGRPRLYPGA